MPRRVARSIVLLAVLVAVLMLPVGAARADDSADWPCVQPLVTSLSFGAYWSAAPAPPEADWRGDPRVAGVVAEVAPRDVPTAEAQARLSAFADAIPAADRPALLAEAFQGLVADVNTERTRIIGRIQELARRQRDLSRIVTTLASELHNTPADTPAAADLVQRRDFATRAFQEAQRTMRYACEVPAALDARLGQFARTLQGRLAD